MVSAAPFATLSRLPHWDSEWPPFPAPSVCGWTWAFSRLAFPDPGLLLPVWGNDDHLDLERNLTVACASLTAEFCCSIEAFNHILVVWGRRWCWTIAVNSLLPFIIFMIEVWDLGYPSFHCTGSAFPLHFLSWGFPITSWFTRFDRFSVLWASFAFKCLLI